MKNFGDKLEVGDRVTYEFEGKIISAIHTTNEGIFNPDCKLIKIERPTYEVVEEIEEEILLTDEEKKLLKQMIDNVNSYSCEKVFKICIQRNRNCTVDVNFYGKTIYLGNIVICLSFDNLRQDQYYTLSELGLEE